MATDDRADALGAQLVRVHRSLRDRLRSLRRQFVPGDHAPLGDDLLQHCPGFRAAVHTHHAGEDGALFSAPRAARPEPAGVVDNLTEDHRLVAGLLARPRGDPASVVGELDGLAAILQNHFAYEERRIASALDALGTRARVADVFDTEVAGGPVVYLLVGLPGSGKTTYAEALRERGVVRLSVDEAMTARHGRLGKDYPEADHLALLGPVVDEVRARLVELVRAGRDVVLDHGLGRRAERDDYKGLVTRHGGRWRLVHFAADRAELARRLAARNEEAGSGLVTPEHSTGSPTTPRNPWARARNHPIPVWSGRDASRRATAARPVPARGSRCSAPPPRASPSAASGSCPAPTR